MGARLGIENRAKDSELRYNNKATAWRSEKKKFQPSLFFSSPAKNNTQRKRHFPFHPADKTELSHQPRAAIFAPDSTTVDDKQPCGVRPWPLVFFRRRRSRIVPYIPYHTVNTVPHERNHTRECGAAAATPAYLIRSSIFFASYLIVAHTSPVVSHPCHPYLESDLQSPHLIFSYLCLPSERSRPLPPIAPAGRS